jgi:hypothetical protein
MCQGDSNSTTTTTTVEDETTTTSSATTTTTSTTTATTTTELIVNEAHGNTDVVVGVDSDQLTESLKSSQNQNFG